MAQVWINGRVLDDGDAAVNARDAGLLHGVGVFTTMAATGGVVFRGEQHFARVRASAKAMHVPLPYEDEELAEAIAAVCGGGQERVRLTVTAGRPTAEGQVPSVLITTQPLGEEAAALRKTGVKAVLLSDWKLNPYDPQAGHKTLDYASRFAALREAARVGCGEALWFNVHNFLQCGSVSNVFLVKDGRLLTPPTQGDLADPANAEGCPYPRSNVLPGITRRAVLEAAAGMGIEAATPALTVNEVLEADEAFVTNSMMRVMPLVGIEQKELEIGEVTRRLADAVDALMDAR